MNEKCFFEGRYKNHRVSIYKNRLRCVLTLSNERKVQQSRNSRSAQAFLKSQETFGVKQVFDRVALAYTKLEPFKALNIIRESPTPAKFKVGTLRKVC